MPPKYILHYRINAPCLFWETLRGLLSVSNETWKMIKKCILEPNENLESKSLNDCTFYKNVYIYAYYNVH